jgi:hypothetical protein
MNWMGGISLLLFWLPGVGGLVAGLVGGWIAGTVKHALVATFLPGLLLGLMMAAGVGYLTEGLLWGLLAGVGGLWLAFFQIGPMLAGALVGGLAAQLWPSARARVGPGRRVGEGRNRG